MVGRKLNQHGAPSCGPFDSCHYGPLGAPHMTESKGGRWINFERLYDFQLPQEEVTRCPVEAGLVCVSTQSDESLLRPSSHHSPLPLMKWKRLKNETDTRPQNGLVFYYEFLALKSLVLPCLINDTSSREYHSFCEILKYESIWKIHADDRIIR